MVVGLLSVNRDLLVLLLGGGNIETVNMTCSVVSCQIDSHASLLGCTSFEQHCSNSTRFPASYFRKTALRSFNRM